MRRKLCSRGQYSVRIFASPPTRHASFFSGLAKAPRLRSVDADCFSLFAVAYALKAYGYQEEDQPYCVYEHFVRGTIGHCVANYSALPFVNESGIGGACAVSC